MPGTWTFAGDILRLGGVPGSGVPGSGISEADADRQTETARSILESLGQQPGIVLGDEVGMGKTYVAMAVISSVLVATRGNPPVVVMVPPGLVSKWQAEWQQFKTTCVADPAFRARFRDSSVRNP